MNKQVELLREHVALMEDPVAALLPGRHPRWLKCGVGEGGGRGEERRDGAGREGTGRRHEWKVD